MPDAAAAVRFRPHRCSQTRKTSAPLPQGSLAWRVGLGLTIDKRTVEAHGYTDAKISIFHCPDGEVIAMGAKDILGGIDITEGFYCMGEVHGQYMQCMTDLMNASFYAPESLRPR